MTYIYYEVSFKTKDNEIVCDNGNLKISSYANKESVKEYILSRLTQYQRDNLVTMQAKYSHKSALDVWHRYI